MRDAVLAHPTDFAGWRTQARALVQAEVPPDAVAWRVASDPPELFAASPAAAEPEMSHQTMLRVPRSFIALAETVILHRDAARFAILYSLLWRIARVEPQLLAIAGDPEVRRAEMMASDVRRDIHKMKAFVRFREITDPAGPLFIAWFEPRNFIVEATASFFMRRFAGMRWSILTPHRTAHWDGEMLAFGPAASRGDAASGDALEELWRRYYASIFNPARLKPEAMKAQMPRRYWVNLPEAQLISGLTRQAASREQRMLEAAPTPALPPRPAARRRTGYMELDTTADPVAALRQRAVGCRACPLFAQATQTVFGEGPAAAALMLVGEQPGDQEDIQGRPFVGPAGALLDRALREAGVDRRQAYVTNAVKHFKFVVRGKRRLHQKPNVIEIAACRSWLTEELALVRPRMVVALGATAARAVLGREVRINAVRGSRIGLSEGIEAVVTVHPSYLLRLPDQQSQREEYDRFVRELADIRSYAPLAGASAD